MGQIIQVHCEQCGFEKDIFVGGGMLDCELKTIHDALPEDGQRMFAVAASYGASQFSLTRKLCACESCGTIYALPIVSYTLKGIRQELYGVCPQCGAAISGKYKEREILHCPDCKGEMTQQQVGYWD